MLYNAYVLQFVLYSDILELNLRAQQVFGWYTKIALLSSAAVLKLDSDRTALASNEKRISLTLRVRNKYC